MGVMRAALRLRSLALGIVLTVLPGCGGASDGPAPAGGAPEPLLVLAASDLQFALPEIVRAYEAGTGQPVRLVLGSTGNLTAQIEQGAPGDLFFAANERFLDRLIGGGHVRAETRAVYGVGRIVLVAREGLALPARLEDLRQPRYGTVAIANPDHAPYGVAAREALEASGVWDEVRPRLVYAENIAQAMQFVRTGNVDAAVVALALVVGGEAEVPHTLIEDSLHAPLRQAAGVLSGSGSAEAASEFLAYVLGPAGRAVLERYGFALPEEP